MVLKTYNEDGEERMFLAVSAFIYKDGSEAKSTAFAVVSKSQAHLNVLPKKRLSLLGTVSASKMLRFTLSDKYALKIIIENNWFFYHHEKTDSLCYYADKGHYYILVNEYGVMSAYPSTDVRGRVLDSTDFDGKIKICNYYSYALIDQKTLNTSIFKCIVGELGKFRYSQGKCISNADNNKKLHIKCYWNRIVIYSKFDSIKTINKVWLEH